MRPLDRGLLDRGLIASLFCLCALAAAPGVATAAPTPDDTYADDEAWLCKPGRDDLCARPVTLVAVGADGRSEARTMKPEPDAPIDCFYVYPTISLDPNGNSSLVPGEGEKRAVRQQFAPFASTCRPYAPMYRQVTLAGLRSLLMHGPLRVDSELAQEDVRAAWRYYLAHFNRGRGVVLVGHSQGSRMLMGLIARDIEASPAQKLIVSAAVVGFPALVPSGADVGGTFRSMPLCRDASQVGCIIAYSTFRETSPPPANARFGRSNTPGSDVACVDVVAMSGQPLAAMLPVRQNLLGQRITDEEWSRGTRGVEGDFVDFPGYVSAGCVKDGVNSYLAMRLNAESRGARPASLPFDIIVQGRLYDDWGLHNIDLNLVMGNLLQVVRRQGEAWAATAH